MTHRFAILALVASACSDSSSPGGPIRIDQLDAAYESFYCSSLVRCGLVDDIATCRSMRSTTSELAPLYTKAQVEAAMAGLITYDGNAAAECLGSYFSTCLRGYIATPRARPAACDVMFVATGGDQAACGAGEECISGVCNETGPCTGSCCQGTCLGSMPPAGRPRLGESCMLNTSCIDSYCDSPSNVCTAYLTIGMQCTSSDQCDAGLACRNGSCGALAGTGEPCSTDSDCQDIGNQCASGVCTRYALLAASCTGSECSPLYRCDAQSHTCAFGPKLGDSCSQTGTCVDASYCDQMTFTCTALLVDGATCRSSSECESNYCDETTTFPGTCATLPVCY